MSRSYRDIKEKIRRKIEENRRLSEIYDGFSCPVCNSKNIVDYPEEDRMEGLAMYWFTGFPQPTMRLRYKYRCEDCGQEW